MSQIESTGDARSYIGAISGRMGELIGQDIEGILREQIETAELVKDFVEITVIEEAKERGMKPPPGSAEAREALDDFQTMLNGIGLAAQEFVGQLQEANEKLNDAQNAFSEFSAE